VKKYKTQDERLRTQGSTGGVEPARRTRQTNGGQAAGKRGAGGCREELAGRVIRS